MGILRTRVQVLNVSHGNQLLQAGSCAVQLLAVQEQRRKARVTPQRRQHQVHPRYRKDRQVLTAVSSIGESTRQPRVGGQCCSLLCVRQCNVQQGARTTAAGPGVFRWGICCRLGGPSQLFGFFYLCSMHVQHVGTSSAPARMSRCNAKAGLTGPLQFRV
jgi:hypothetical protein